MITMLTQEEWQALVPHVLPDVLRQHFDPLRGRDVKITPTRENGKAIPTAFIDLYDGRISASPHFLNHLVSFGVTPEEALKGVLLHEVGHYARFPYDVATYLYWYSQAKTGIREHDDSKAVMGMWIEFPNNIPLILGEDPAVRRTYRAFCKYVEDLLTITDEEEPIVIARSHDPRELERIARDHDPSRFQVGYYQELLQEYYNDPNRSKNGFFPERDELDLQVEIGNGCLRSSIDALLKSPLAGMGNVVRGYHNFEPHKQLEAFHTFRGTYRTLLENRAKVKESLMPTKIEDEDTLIYIKMLDRLFGKPQGKEGSGGEASGNPSDDESDIIDVIDLPPQALEEGLSKLIQTFGKYRFDYIMKTLGLQQRKPRDSEQKPSVGTEGVDTITFYDDEIPYYQRRAAGAGIYIKPRPLVTDATDAYRQGKEEFEPGTPIAHVDRWSSPKTLPGITKRHLFNQARHPVRKMQTPDALIWLDTSGSMPTPHCSSNNNHDGSESVDGGFVLARNYHANGQRVGVVNFSVDFSYLAPTRDIQQVYHYLCGYYGGGTVLNIEKIREKIERQFKGVFSSTSGDYEDFMNRHLSPEERRDCYEKHIVLKPQRIKDVYGRLDNLFITDGGIANIEEVIAYINQMGKITRNVIYLLGNASLADQWNALNLPQTQIVSLNRAALRSTVIGHARRTFAAEK